MWEIAQPREPLICKNEPDCRIINLFSNGFLHNLIMNSRSYLRYGISIWIDIPLDIMAGEKFANSDDTSDAFDKVNPLIK